MATVGRLSDLSPKTLRNKFVNSPLLRIAEMECAKVQESRGSSEIPSLKSKVSDAFLEVGQRGEDNRLADVEPLVYGLYSL